jgi:hypothetical protein
MNWTSSKIILPMHILELNIYTLMEKLAAQMFSCLHVLIHPLDKYIFHITMYCSSQNATPSSFVFLPKPSTPF